MDISCERLMLGEFRPLIEHEHLARYRFAMQHVEGMRVADIACGTGYGSVMLAKGGARSVHGMDISEDAVSFCLEHNNALNVTYSVADGQKLTAISDRSFDIVVSFETIEHLIDVESYLDEMARILRPGGTFLVSTPDRRISSVLYCISRRPANKYHVREYTERELINLLSHRFQIVACYGQAFVHRLLVLWPVQVFIKTTCRILGSIKARDFKDNLYSNKGNVEVILKKSVFRIPKYWVICCIRPENSVS